MLEMVRASKDEFNRLDGAQGDGDLGVTVELVMEAVHQAAQEHSDIKKWLIESGSLVRRKAPSTMGVLIAFALSAAGRSLQDGALPTTQTFVKIQEVMIDEIMKRGEADVGDRTVLDALVPAFEAYRDAVVTGSSAKLALEFAAEAALKGAEGTRNLTPKTGRASWVGERAVGEIDGGAWFCYMVYHTLRTLP
ncbi:DAK2 domain-containing protein [Alicyclobacillus dauci]|uniref:DAK2 domain-containing protein n=1 Tax=Alicyclobacillus dauci TaxID=1475485 RepID=A0ABY6YYR3_9BACL|nr:DAK2 domain-containing protein [Alicyclobacillus dauci]WAH35772.1 DAK2 domain-containing protein [Alicyclobacillus dauci]